MRTLLIDDMRIMAVTRTERNYDSGINALKEEIWDILFLDHDLGDFCANGRERTGYDILCWLEEHIQYLPKRIHIVSQNNVGRDRMKVVVDKLYEN